MTGKPHRDPTAELPLKPVTFHILLVLADGVRHGYRLVQEIEERTAGQLQLQAGNLYRTLRTMKERGLIDESARRPAAAVDDATMKERGLIDESARRPAAAVDDARRRYFRITNFGVSVAIAEASRLEGLVAEARSRSLLPE